MKKTLRNLSLRKGLFFRKSNGLKTKVTYSCPIDDNDMKRLGRELTITVGNDSMTFNGTQLRSIKKVLVDAGEISY